MNQFHNPDNDPFEFIGYAEELMKVGTHKFLGTRRVPELTRPPGSEGMITYTITENVTLQKGHKTVILKASPKRPVHVISMFMILGGRDKKI